MKSKEELDALKKEVEAVNEKLQELTKEELELVNGGGYAIASPGAFVIGLTTSLGE